MRRFPVIIGPTAGGKSRLAVHLAQALERAGRAPCEVVSADSVQVYRGMDIGSAKPGDHERAGVAHHLIDIAEPDEPFTLRDWLTGAEDAIDDIRARGGVPVVVGGTHLYIKALLEGLFEGPGADPDLRRRLGEEPPERLRARLEEADPEAAARIHPNDLRRTIRALEVHAATGRPLSEQQRQWDAGRRRSDALLVALRWPAPEINRRINARVKGMLEAGLRDEVRRLREAGRLGEQARQSLGYSQLLDHLDGRTALEEAVERIKIETRRFAKSQRTWQRRLLAGGPSLTLDAPPEDPKGWSERVVEALLACEHPASPEEGAEPDHA